MSNLKVLVAWDTSATFAGEEIRCTITFRNTAPDPYQHRASTAPQPRASSVTPTAGGLRGKEWTATPRAGRPAPLISDKSKKPGHRQTVSLNAPSTTRFSSNPNTPTVDQHSRGSRTPTHSHKRSISIVSHGSVENGSKEGKAAAAAPKPNTSRRGSHTRAASYHGSPSRSMPGSALLSPKTNGGPLSASLRSPRAPPLVRAATAQAAKTGILHTPGFEPARSPLLNNLDEEAITDDASQTIESVHTPLSAPLKQRPFPSPLPYRDKHDHLPLQRVLSPLGTEATPRSSMDLISNYSEDTMASEYVHGHMLRQVSGPRHVRQHSSLPPVQADGSQVEHLMMAYVQLHGSFVLDGSLVDQSSFEPVKQMAVIGGQGSGGVVGIGTPTKRNSGLLGSFGLSSLSSSFGGILGGQEMSSMRDMKVIANTKSIPLISTPQSILFVDLQLGPGQSKSFTYSHQLPPDLPPSHKGRAIKIEYQLTIGTQRAQTVGQKNNVRQVDVPFRIFPGILSSGQLIPHDLFEPHVLLRDQSVTKAVEDRNKPASSPTPSSKQASVINSKSAFLAYTDQLLQSSQTAAGEALLSPTEARRESRLFPLDSESAAAGIPMKDLIELAITRNALAAAISTSTNQFAIQRAGNPVAIINIVRPAYRLGETTTAVVDLRSSYTNVYSLNASLETEEFVDEALALRSASSIRRATHRVHGHATETVINQQRAVFSFMVPWHATPEFATSGVRLEWRLRFEFVTSTLPKTEEELMEEEGRDERGSTYAALQELYTESFEVAVPLRVFGAEGGAEKRLGALSI